MAMVTIGWMGAYCFARVCWKGWMGSATWLDVVEINVIGIVLELVETIGLIDFGPKLVQIADSDRFRPVLYRNRPVPYRNWSIQYRTVRFHTGLYSTTRDPWISIFVFKTLN